MKTKLKVAVFIVVVVALCIFILKTTINAENLFSNAISNAEEIVQKEEIIMYDGLIAKKDAFNYYLDDIYIPLASRQLIGIDEIEGAPEYEKLYSESDIEIAAKIILKEAESVKDNCGVSGDCHRAAVIWCILNRVMLDMAILRKSQRRPINLPITQILAQLRNSTNLLRMSLIDGVKRKQELRMQEGFCRKITYGLGATEK